MLALLVPGVKMGAGGVAGGSTLHLLPLVGAGQ